MMIIFTQYEHNICITWAQYVHHRTIIFTSYEHPTFERSVINEYSILKENAITYKLCNGIKMTMLLTVFVFHLIWVFTTLKTGLSVHMPTRYFDAVSVSESPPKFQRKFSWLFPDLVELSLIILVLRHDV